MQTDAVIKTNRFANVSRKSQSMANMPNTPGRHAEKSTAAERDLRKGTRRGVQQGV
jgi:hypothetical protein